MVDVLYYKTMVGTLLSVHTSKGGLSVSDSSPAGRGKKQGQKLVLSDALAVQSEGLRVPRSKGFKS